MAYFSRQKTAFNKAFNFDTVFRRQPPSASASSEQSTALNVCCGLCQQLKKPPVTSDEIANSVTQEDPRETQKRWKSECAATTVRVNMPTSGEKMTEVQKGLILLILLSGVAEVNHLKDHFNHLSKLEQSRTRRPSELSCYFPHCIVHFQKLCLLHNLIDMMNKNGIKSSRFWRLPEFALSQSFDSCFWSIKKTILPERFLKGFAPDMQGSPQE